MGSRHTFGVSFPGLLYALFCAYALLAYGCFVRSFVVRTVFPRVGIEVCTAPPGDPTYVGGVAIPHSQFHSEVVASSRQPLSHISRRRGGAARVQTIRSRRESWDPPRVEICSLAGFPGCFLAVGTTSLRE